MVTGEWMLFFVIIWSARRGETGALSDQLSRREGEDKKKQERLCVREVRAQLLKHTTSFMVATKVFGKCSHYALEICTLLNCCM